MLDWRLGISGVLMALMLAGCTFVFEETSTPTCFKDVIGCPQSELGYAWNSYEGSCSCYASTNTFRDAHVAETECASRDYGDFSAHLLVIDDAAEQAIIDDDTNILDEDGGTPGAFMLGLFYNTQAEEWRWTTGELLDLSATGVTFEPVPTNGEHCARSVRNSSNAWVTRACDNGAGSVETICELDGKSVTITAPGF